MNAATAAAVAAVRHTVCKYQQEIIIFVKKKLIIVN